MKLETINSAIHNYHGRTGIHPEFILVDYDLYLQLLTDLEPLPISIRAGIEHLKIAGVSIIAVPKHTMRGYIIIDKERAREILR